MERVEARIQEINLAMQQAQEAIESDTKSSAGDKYETSREMIQQDLNRYQHQLEQAKKDGVLLRSITDEPKLSAVLGAIVRTDRNTYFLANSAGLVHVNGQQVVVVSPVSPIGKLLMDAQLGDEIIFNGLKQQVLEIA